MTNKTTFRSIVIFGIVKDRDETISEMTQATRMRKHETVDIFYEKSRALAISAWALHKLNNVQIWILEP